MTDVHIPKMGMSTVEVDVLAVHVAEGDAVEAGDVLFEIEGDKTTFEVEAPVAGVVGEVLVREGAVQCVGDLAVRIET